MSRGVITALITPFDEKNQVNYQVLKELVEYQVNSGVKAILLLGTTAETPTLSLEEQELIIKTVIQKVNKRLKIIVGVGSNNTLDVLKKCELFSKYEIDAFMVVTPYYNKGNDNGLIKHFSCIADNSKKPIIIYNVPKRTGVFLSIDIIRALRNHPNIIGIKEASGDMHFFQKVLMLKTDQFKIYQGDDCLFLPSIILNCEVISVASNIIPSQLLELVDFIEKGNINKAIENYLLYFPFLERLYLETSPIPIKEIMNYQGLMVGPTRLPLEKMDKELLRLLIDSYKVI